MRIAQEIAEISKVYADDEMNLTEKYQALVDSIDYGKLYRELIWVFPQLKDGAERGDWNSGTVGWHNALVETVGRSRMDEMFKDLEWYDCDHLDGAIEAKLDDWYKARAKRRERFEEVDKFVEDALLERDFVFGDTAAEIRKRIVEVTPNTIKVEVQVRPTNSAEEIKFELRLEQSRPTARD